MDHFFMISLVQLVYKENVPYCLEVTSDTKAKVKARRLSPVDETRAQSTDRC